MKELWQLYDESGNPIHGQGAEKAEVYSKGLLHSAAHVWLWRVGDFGPEILLQKRAATKTTWPNHYDVSAAGHVDLGEEPLAAALREAHEELGLEIAPADLHPFGVHRAHLEIDSDVTENEFQWLYLLELPHDTQFTLQVSEVTSVEWKPLSEFKAETNAAGHNYVPHGQNYFDIIIQAIAGN